MSATGQDYYELLGVERGASDQEIKKAFRRLARELHPDVSDHPEAEARFREVSEAYEVLSNAETRQLYDRYGHAGLRSGGFQPSQSDFGSLSDIFSAFFGEDFAQKSNAIGAMVRIAQSAHIYARCLVTVAVVFVPTTRGAYALSSSRYSAYRAVSFKRIPKPRMAGSTHSGASVFPLPPVSQSTACIKHTSTFTFPFAPTP